MMNFKIWLIEGSIDPKEVESIKASLEKDGYADVTMTPSGEILGPTSGLDWHRNKASGMDKRRSTNVMMYKGDNYKKIGIRTFGGLVQPGGRDIMQSLKGAGVIDDSWEFDPKFTPPSAYIGHDYTNFQGGMHGEKPTVGSMINRPPLTKDVTPDDLILWHGTSSLDWKKIKEDGKIVPLFHGNNQQHGFESRAKHQYNKDHLYLAANENIAFDFAQQRSRDQNRKLHPKEWEYIKHDGPSRWPIKPVLLKVKVPSIKNLRADDDPVNNILQKIGDRIWERKSDKEKEEITQYLRKKTGYDLKDSSVVRMVWREDDDTGWPEIEAKIPARAYKAWLASIIRKGHVAYEGHIPISNVQEVPFIPRDEEEN